MQGRNETTCVWASKHTSHYPGRLGFSPGSVGDFFQPSCNWASAFAGYEQMGGRKRRSRKFVKGHGAPCDRANFPSKRHLAAHSKTAPTGSGRGGCHFLKSQVLPSLAYSAASTAPLASGWLYTRSR